jgi:nitroreductase
MNELERLLITRRSCRAYKPDAIHEDVLERILEAGKYAPTGRNRQAPIIIAVTNREMRDRMSKLNAAVMGVDSDPFYGAPVVLVVLAKKEVPTYIYDGSLVMGNLMNAAHSEGVGSCWIHRAREVFASEEGKEILSSLGIEGEYEGIGNCILGYPVSDETTIAQPRKEDYVYYIK